MAAVRLPTGGRIADAPPLRRPSPPSRPLGVADRDVEWPPPGDLDGFGSPRPGASGTAASM